MKKTPVFLESLVTNMLRLRAICPFSWRVFQFRPISCEPLIIQMNKCTDEEQMFGFIERNKAILSEKQVGCAFDMLWKLQKQKTSLLKNAEYVRDHPQFLTLHNLATNKFKLMNDDTLVNVLYVTQQFDIKLLSEFSSCLADQHLYFSPLMGKIADIVHRNLETTQDLSSLSVLMVNISSLISRHFQQQLVNKTELLFDTIDSSEVNVAKSIAKFLRNVRYRYQPLLERCNNVFLSNVDHLDLDSISKILSVYKFLQFNSFEFIIMAKKKLTEMIPLCNHPASFVKLFVALGPIAGPEEKKQLKSTMLLMSEDLTGEQALAVLGAMGDMESRNSCLIKRVTSVLHKHLDGYKPLELLKITQELTFLHFQRKEFFAKLRELLLSYLKNSFIPTEVSVLVRAISLLPSPHLDEVGISRIEAVLPQCDLNNLSSFATSVLRWIQHDHMYLDNMTAKQLKLLQKLDHYGRQRLQHSNSLDLLRKELKSLKGNTFPESLLEEMIATLQHFMDDINYINVGEIASFISSTDYLSTLLLDRIASVAVQQIEKIHPFTIPAIIRPFSVLNYDPPQRDEFLGTCVQHLNSYLGILDPFILVFLGFSLATLEYFPEDLLKAIFNIKFLARLDSQLESIGGMDGTQQQIFKMLAEVLGGINCVKASVLTPYYHKVDFECILDKRKKPLPYGSHNIALGQLPEMPWESNIEIVGSRLPPGAERIALEFLDSKALCRNIPHMKGKSAMKKRHLEILGYRVIQISQFEWNSMALSTKDARMDYLRECIFGEVKSCL
ncbi:FAST kinase domain-containing protein 1, mitochondrial isoform 4 [Homo sapiens]|uniref:FAST kinase domain-containing protein 1, mitochondrial isoform 4 n=1 Tax=Homo sapiens TaxID=9606 RepID=UPI00078AF255|nr:FAST kinase domain-containing protein 1, mitochondrial isoform 4 [Homo sapiens]XP_047301788.1 FAST kinase domain-containing protein 1, mitochondrial isoform X3 [Homo sapiens]|eukprot:NP_001308978.1 FAST kinase domain-containing protein 1, mitochondrial isoform 4 [Homo sapiens]